ncbi:hypothetical protein AYI68_g6236 [Smittium mucronatum]|uniref:Uncharacterized protein n=1 Tax=Smittium mucronatum TaxID=133383 RepID=A0A1R0GS12_9FUNG|nr:hypothetical protein AYI68_g6236 [Smittium mucronatum]
MLYCLQLAPVFVFRLHLAPVSFFPSPYSCSLDISLSRCLDSSFSPWLELLDLELYPSFLIFSSRTLFISSSKTATLDS